MTVLCTETGFLNPAGEVLCRELKAEIKNILSTQDDPIRARTLGCMLMKLVGDEVSETMRRLQCKSTS